MIQHPWSPGLWGLSNVAMAASYYTHAQTHTHTRTHTHTHTEQLGHSVRFTMLLVRVCRALGPLSRGGPLSPWKRARSSTAGRRLDLSGIYPPIATPFTAEEDVDYQKLEGNLRQYARIPFRGQNRDPVRRSRQKGFRGRVRGTRPGH